MKDNRDYHKILYEDYPEIWQLWSDAVNADFRAFDLQCEGKIVESEEAWREHQEKWDQYVFLRRMLFGC